MSDHSPILAFFKAFKRLKVLVIGDVMLDAYIYGEVNRISPEAPIPVVSVTKKEQCLGGAANVALNLQSMGATAHLYTVIGADSQGTALHQLLEKHKLSTSGVIQSSHRRTTVKSRVISKAQHLVRFDEEDTHALNREEEKALLHKVSATINAYDVVVFEDYDKGCLDPKIIKKVIELAKAHGKPTVVDPKKNNFMSYEGVTLFKPNLKELQEGLGQEVSLDNLKQAATLLNAKLNADLILITLSQHGVFYQDQNDQGIIPAHIRDIANVSGAGDTVIAVAALCLAAGATTRQLAHLANLAGGIVCESPGIVPIDPKRLIEEIQAEL